MTMSSPGSTSRMNGGAEMSQGGGLASDDPAPLEAAEHERAHALRVAGGIQRVSSMKTKENAPLQRGQQLERGLLERAVLVAGEQRGDERGVGGVAAGELAGVRAPPKRSSTRASSSTVLMRLPLWARASVLRRCRRASAGRSPTWSRRSSSSACGRCDVAAERAERGLVEDLRRRGPCPCRRGSSRRHRSRCRPTPARGAAARRARSTSASRRPLREPRRRRPRRRPAGPSRRG